MATVAPSVTPVIGTVTQITTGGTAVQVVPANANGGYISNPVTNTEQGIATAEPIFVNPISSPGSTLAAGNGSTSTIQPGQTYTLIPGSTLPVYVNAATSNHKFTVVYY